MPKIIPHIFLFFFGGKEMQYIIRKRRKYMLISGTTTTTTTKFGCKASILQKLCTSNMETIHQIYKIQGRLTKVPIIPKISLHKIICSTEEAITPSEIFLFLSRQCSKKIACGNKTASFFLAFLPKKPSQRR